MVVAVPATAEDREVKGSAEAALEALIDAVDG